MITPAPSLDGLRTVWTCPLCLCSAPGGRPEVLCRVAARPDCPVLAAARTQPLS